MRKEVDLNPKNSTTSTNQSGSQYYSQSGQHAPNKSGIPFQFLNMGSIEYAQQKKSIDISCLSQTEQMPNEKQKLIPNKPYKQRESRVQQRDSKTKIFRMRDNSDPTTGCQHNDNKSLPKLNQNDDIFQTINKQILERSYMNSNIYKGQHAQWANQTINQLYLDRENKGSPIKRIHQKNATPFRNSLLANQRVTSNITYKPLTTANLDFNDSPTKSQKAEQQSLHNENFSSQLYTFEMEEGEQQQAKSINCLKRNSYKRTQFKLTEQMTMQDKNKQQKQQANANEEFSHMSNQLIIPLLYNNHRNTEIYNEDSVSSINEIIGNKDFQLSKDEIFQMVKNKYQNTQFQAYLQQSNQDYEPINQDQNQFNKSKLSFRVSSCSRQGTSMNIQDQDIIQKRQNNKNKNSVESNIQNQMPAVKNLSYLERSLLTEREQAILKRTQLISEGQPPSGKVKRENYDAQIPSSRNGKIKLQLNRSQSRNKQCAAPPIKRESMEDHTVKVNEMKTNEINFFYNERDNNKILNLINTSLQEPSQIKNSRKFSSLNNLDDFQDENDDFKELDSQFISTDVAQTSSDKISQMTNSQKLLNYKSQLSSNDNHQPSSPNIFIDRTEEQSTQCGSRDDESANQKQQIQKSSQEINVQESAKCKQQFLQRQENCDVKQQSPIMNQQKSLTQQTPRGKQQQHIQYQQVQNIASLLKVSMSKYQGPVEQRQFIRTKRSIPLQSERNSSINQQKKEPQQQKLKAKSSMNLDNAPEEKGSKSPTKKGNKQKIIKSIPEVSSKCWSVFNVDENDMLYGKNYNFQVEIASLTKIMTCYVTILFLEENKLENKKVYIEVSKAATKTIGTTANLEKGDFVSAHELLYGLMLPSGNDAAVVLSEGIGYLLLRLQQKLSFTSEHTSSETSGDDNIYISYKAKSDVGGLNACSAIFIKEMNRLAWKLGLEKTNYACVHGLSNRYNISTARDVGLLSCIVMKHPLVQKIVNTKEYESQDVLDSNKNNEDQYEWENTNQMLEKKGYDGLKTGVTDTAGPCLSSSYKCKRNGKQLKLICILLNCKSMDHRWPETKQLISWSLKNFYPKETKKGDEEASSSYSPSPPKNK